WQIRTAEEHISRYITSQTGGIVPDDNYQLLYQSDNYQVYKVFDDYDGSSNIELISKINDATWIYMRSNYQNIQESADISNRMLTYVGGIVTLLGIFVMFFVSRGYTKPIMRLVDHAKKMSELDFDVRYSEKRLDEIGVLGKSMNVLSEKLETTISELKTANNELQSDIERKQEQDEMRNEFLANVSHELKTPLALIQGYAEGLQDNINDDKKSREYYCEVIIDEAEKMNTMVKKLLNLNQLEFGSDQVHMERFDIVCMIKSKLQANDILAKQKETNLIFTCEEKGPIIVWSDEYMIDEVVTNYISNALHHVDLPCKSNYKEKVVEAKVVVIDNKVRISVFNTGTPIPEEDITKIWDKFYKVDKAHTREYGGNGIGLSIVKAVMEAHNQKYGVKNYENGVEFWFELDYENVD
ncbi:MAG: HAMP domain-containing histidine kinase, partial [Lachnoclostridium sp.]|nr:HAMP domain-containing histidine kinase [Lachnoclostridium sp.]